MCRYVCCMFRDDGGSVLKRSVGFGWVVECERKLRGKGRREELARFAEGFCIHEERSWLIRW